MDILDDRERGIIKDYYGLSRNTYDFTRNR